MDDAEQHQIAVSRLLKTAKELSDLGIADRAIAEALASLLARGLIDMAGPAEAARIFRVLAARSELQADPAEMAKC